MSAEERWAQQKEWDQERGEIEIKFTRTIEADVFQGACEVKRCLNGAVKEYGIGRVQDSYGRTIDLCEEHDSEDVAFELYQQ